ncbi:MAG: mechanosensitive ion channel family protein [Mesorhizobium sp.]|uniref:mechanosensitive ion channel family protein n=2 Tax=Mesorhizobium TaxID=68287 RepID=UPI000A8E6251|nr:MULTISPECIES: mechanosensitive ion channel family protein [unclassified Mesorhizobium]RWB27260.1 MAG: mechanosensitive ion channel family protein [Mesorhizobium sp.]RWB59326.1 MAG: mechanosensitive ion channel family protein [Mesorhizobium sp.]RWC25005.1 MAG: mechanosensitive ion channel family protein [Mesorhizobium sp.]RWC27991.1 MAG: mechanosensitive ion channel family protein [Mesorhizobium sp.]RWD85088.1 MAG: mechanosensitive ion channel family protein [Mesorhizobium sp.]
MDAGPVMNWWNSPHLYMVLVGLAGIVVWRHSAAALHHETDRPDRILSYYVGPLLNGAVVPYEPTRGNETAAGAILVGSAKVLWWAHLAWALIGFVRMYLVFERKPREARLLQDLVVGMVYVAMLLSILAFVFDAPIGALNATSGVFAITLGLAFQNTLSDVFSGIALNLGAKEGRRP